MYLALVYFWSLHHRALEWIVALLCAQGRDQKDATYAGECLLGLETPPPAGIK
jgi:hypothetical protein